MKPNRSFWLFGGLLALLVLGLASQFLFQIGRPPSAAKMDAQVIPSKLTGVQTKDLEIAGTESVSKAVEEGLGFSDYRYREYRHGEVSFTVYLAYWQDREASLHGSGHACAGQLLGIERLDDGPEAAEAGLFSSSCQFKCKSGGLG